MSKIQSSGENITINADGANNDIKFQSNGSEVASIDQAGTITATTFTGAATDATKLPLAGGTMTGNLTVGTTSVADPVLLIQSSGGGDPQLNLSSAAANRSGKIKFLDNGSAVGGFINYLHNGDKMEFGSGSSTTVGFRVCDGYSNAAQGLTFGTDTGAANKLDDYEEGDWTPVVTGGGSAPSSITFHTDPSGKYTKVGRVVTVQFYLHINLMQGGSGIFKLTGVPFAATSANGGFKGGVTMYYANTSSHSGPVLQINGNAELSIETANGSGGYFSNVSWTAAPLSAFTSAAVAGSVTYFTS